MIALYGMASPNVYKVTIMLEEAALPYRLHYVDVFAGDQFEEPFRRLSATGKAPLIVDPDSSGGAPLVLAESGAILIHLAEKAGILLSREARPRALELQWLMIQVAALGPMSGQANHFLRFAPEIGYGRVRYANQAALVHAQLDARLAQSRFLGGDAYSIADVATFPWIRHAQQVFPWLVSDGALAARYPDLARWFEEVAARPAVRRGIEVMGELKARTEASRAAASPDAMDRLVQRGRFAALSEADLGA